MLRPGDRVHIEGSSEEAIVRTVRTHEVLVHVFSVRGDDERSYAHERLRLAPAAAA